MSQTSDPQRKVPTRRISFDDALAEVPKYFAAEGDLIISHLVANLSAVFPDGEDFFVRSVRHYRDQITDPELKRQVAGFIGQEATHGREHRSLNERLAELGYPTKGVENFTRRALAIRERLLPPISNLAATAALEHFTATFAELLLTDEETRVAMGDTEVTNVFVWHALEESEHKAVAFDVYKAVGGGERLRTFTMNAFIVGFLGSTLVQLGLSLAADRETYRGGNLLRSWRRVRNSVYLQPDLLRRLREYNKPDFHPDDRDTRELTEHWAAVLFGSEGALTDRLARPTPPTALAG